MNPVVVFDCMIFLQSLISPHGPSGKCLKLAEFNRIEVWTSSDIFDEVMDVASRPEFHAKQTHITLDSVRELALRIQSCCRFARQINPRIQFLRDPNDECYLNLCLTIRSDFLVTFDRDLLDIDNDQHPDRSEVRSRLPDLRIVTPQSFLQIIDQEYPKP